MIRFKRKIIIVNYLIVLCVIVFSAVVSREKYEWIQISLKLTETYRNSQIYVCVEYSKEIIENSEEKYIDLK